jgi:hypothetical protein
MRLRFWRRVVAALALMLGIGVAVPAVHADAATTHSSSTHSSTTTSPASFQDWWW